MREIILGFCSVLRSHCPIVFDSSFGSFWTGFCYDTSAVMLHDCLVTSYVIML